MSDDELLAELHILGQYLVGLGVGSRPAAPIELFKAASDGICCVLARLQAHRARLEYERDQRN